MPGVIKKNKQKSAKKVLEVKKATKFVSESVSVTENSRCKQNLYETTFSLSFKKRNRERNI